jgi:ABC-type dipeptide/oligopeptide/nickel transport system ATPase subunit
LAALPPAAVATTAAVVAAPVGLQEAARALGASRRQVIRDVVVPSATLETFAGIRLAVGMAYSSVVAAKLFNGLPGIGGLVKDASNYNKHPRRAGLALKYAGVPRERRAERRDHLLARVGLEGTADRKIWEISGGQQQRVAIARALAAETPLFLLDEPFAALDALTRERLQEDVRRVGAESGRTTVFVAQQRRRDCVSRFADRRADAAPGAGGVGSAG